ncbi:MAG TPA: M28 family peptidase, partial [Acidobacteriota bacterium]|nr:M28 family peptidase [Acidobacteriota bacterium]
ENQEMCKSTLNLDRTPDSLPSYLNDFVFGLVKESVREFGGQTLFGAASTFRYNTMAFSGGSDHAEFTNSTIGVPCVMLLQWPDLYYHTSMDTIDKVSEDTLKRVGWITTVAALTLANATAETAFQLAYQTASKSIIRIEKIAQEAIEELFKKKEDSKLRDKPAELAKELAKTALYYKSKIEHAKCREQKATRSVEKFGGSQELDASVDKLCEDIASRAQQKIARLDEALNFIAMTLSISIPAEVEETKADAELKKLIPNRLFKGTLNFDVLKVALGEKEFEWYLEIDEKDRELSKKTEELVNFMDGKRIAHSILKAISAEYTPTNPEYMLKFLRDLEKAKLITFL